jgi:hypothetical protein
MNTADARITASAFFKSGMFPNLKNEAQAYVLILAGEEMGVGPMEAVTGITLIQGKPTMSANLLAALVKRHPRYDYRVADHSDSTCRIEFIQDGEVSGVSEFTLDDAKKAGLGGNQTWKKYPSALLFARALTQGVRWYAPDVTSSAAYTPEELGGEPAPTDVQDTHPVVQDVQPQESEQPLSELAQLVEEVGFSQEEREALRTWIRQNPEVHAATAVDLLKDGNKGAILAALEFEAEVVA